MHLTLYNFIFQIDKKLVNFRFFWNTLISTLTINTGLAINTLTMSTGLAVKIITMNKACLLYLGCNLEVLHKQLLYKSNLTLCHSIIYWIYIRQALFVVSVWMAKPVFVVSVLVVSVGLRVFQKNLKFSNFFVNPEN